MSKSDLTRFFMLSVPVLHIVQIIMTVIVLVMIIDAVATVDLIAATRVNGPGEAAQHCRLILL